MVKVGFIDYYLSEWHADNLPTWLREETKGEMQVTYAWGYCQPPIPGRVTNEEWAKTQGVTLCATEQEVVDKSDVLVVLSPDNPEMHEILCDKALRSGKRTYVDKTFAPSLAVAKGLIEKAKAHHTPMFTSSALRFSNELQGVERNGIRMVCTQGPGVFEIYSIHQIEPIISLLGPDARQVMYIGNAQIPAAVIRFANGAMATMHMFGGACPFRTTIGYDGDKTPSIIIDDCTNYFPNFVTQLVDFFKTGDIKAPWKETLAVAAVREALFVAKEQPGVWVDVPDIQG